MVHSYGAQLWCTVMVHNHLSRQQVRIRKKAGGIRSFHAKSTNLLSDLADILAYLYGYNEHMEKISVQLQVVSKIWLAVEL